MSESRAQWEGQVVNDEFRLEKYLGGSSQSSVFLTGYRGTGQSQAAIKLVPDDATSRDLYLSRWRLAEKLSHPHLIRLLEDGSCRLDDTEFLFVVMEYAEENLAEVLPQRALTPAEVRDLLGPALDALRYLHGRGLVHGHLKPGNILAANDKIKLSSDGLCAPGAPAGPEKPTPYDAPEKASGPFSPAADIWSLGMILAEAMTQRLPAWSEKEPVDPLVPEKLPEPYLEIVRGCLRWDPQRRLTVADISARLRPAQPSPGPPQPSASLQSEPVAQTQPPTLDQPQNTSQAQPSLLTRSLILPLIIAVMGVIGLFAVLGLVTRRAESRDARPPSVKAESKPQSQAQPATVQPAPANGIRPGTTHDKPSPSGRPAEASPSSLDPKPEGVDSTNVDSAVEPSAGSNQVIRQVMPDIPQRSLDTIQGTVRVGIRVQVDSAGNVVDTAVDFEGPSRYFARLAEKAARRWKFAPSDNMEREFILHFDFGNAVTSVSATEVAQ